MNTTVTTANATPTVENATSTQKSAQWTHGSQPTSFTTRGVVRRHEKQRSPHPLDQNLSLSLHPSTELPWRVAEQAAVQPQADRGASPWQRRLQKPKKLHLHATFPTTKIRAK